MKPVTTFINKRKNILLSALVGFILMLVNYTVIHNHYSGSSHEKIPGNVDSFVEDAKYTNYDHDGHFHSQLSSKQVNYFGKLGLMTLEKPLLLFLTKEHTTIRVTADAGENHDSNHSIVLRGNVTIVALDRSGKPEKKMTTTDLTIYPKTQTFQTDAPVSIEQAGEIFSGIGLTGNLKTGNIKIIHHSHGTYTPRASS